MRYLIDTNVLLRWSDADDPHHVECFDAVNRAIDNGGRPCSCAQVIIESWATATRPREVNGFGMSCAQADQMIADVRKAFLCLPEPPDIADVWQRLVVEHNVMGRQAHDARLAAFMIAHGIEHLITLNTADFARYPEITPLTPAEVLAL